MLQFVDILVFDPSKYLDSFSDKRQRLVDGLRSLFFIC